MGTDPGEARPLVFLPCFFISSCTYGYDSAEHKLITLTEKKERKKEQILCYKPLSSYLRHIETPLPNGQLQLAPGKWVVQREDEEEDGVSPKKKKKMQMTLSSKVV